MTCPVCRAIEGQGDCADCRALAGEMRANAEALSALRHEELPPNVISVSRRAPAYSWVAAVAAAVLLAIALPYLRHSAGTPPQTTAPPAGHGKGQPIKIKMLTPDPDVVIYWLIDSREGE